MASDQKCSTGDGCAKSVAVGLSVDDEPPVGDVAERAEHVAAQIADLVGVRGERAEEQHAAEREERGGEEAAGAAAPRTASAPMPRLRRCSDTSRLVMRNPDSVKNALTPRKPPRAPVTSAWNRTTATTARPRRPSNAGTRVRVPVPPVDASHRVHPACFATASALARARSGSRYRPRRPPGPGGSIGRMSSSSS